MGTEEILTAGKAMDINMIQKILPHRYPFLLVDKIIEISGNKIIKVVYSCDSAGKMLKRKEYAMKDIIEENIKESGIEKDILPLDDFSAQYMRFDLQTGSVEWMDSWKKEDGLFTAIRFKGKLHNEEFTRTIFIPISQ